jgi:RHS repeat-associated protein
VTTCYYDTTGRLDHVDRPNSTRQRVTFDDANRLTNSYEEKMSAGTVVATLWQAGYGYDNANRLTSFVPNPMAQNNPPPTVTMTHDSDNQLATYNGQAVGHDLDGNLLSVPVVSGTQLGALTWDTRNRLTSAGGVTYVYDAENRRTSSTTGGQKTTYVYSRGAKLDRLLLKQNPDGSVTRYIYGDGLLYEETTNAAVVAQSPVYYHYDWRGDTVALSDATGSVTARLSYSPYGVPTVESGTVTTPFCFNGKWGVMTEPSGLLSMQARYYSPILQRFLNEDPSGFDGGGNLYAFANGDPIDLMDPFGLGAVNNAFYGNTSSSYGNVLSNQIFDSGQASKNLGIDVQGVPTYVGSPVINQTSPDFYVNHNVPMDAVTQQLPSGQIVYTPPSANFQSVFDTAQTVGSVGIKTAVGQYGMFDYQRNEGAGKLATNNFYPAYTDASNVAVGVYMNGAEYGPKEIHVIGYIYAVTHSSNAGTPAQNAMWQAGWNAANSMTPAGVGK